VVKLSVLFNATDSQKYLGYAICQACKICQTFCLWACRAGYKPMQPMQLLWAPHLSAPATWYLGRLFIPDTLALENSIETV